MKHVAPGLLLVLCLAANAAPREDLTVADFEGDTYGAWTATGSAFGTGPARGTLPGQMKVDGFAGRGLVNSFAGGDGATGTLASAAFRVERKRLRFLIGGGGYAEETCMNLLVGTSVVRTATGPNVVPGGSERLAPAEWDIEEFEGREARIEMVDRRTGGWGHLNVDQIVQTDRPMPKIVTATRAIRIENRYLNLPVKNGAPKRRLAVRDGDAVVREFEIELAEAAPDWWSILDVSAWKGRDLTLEIAQVPEDFAALAQIEVADAIRDAKDLYREPLRPQIHFSSHRGWLNDPNGLVWHDGEYHLFYQHNPYGWPWGNMHWGHAVSSDMVHWKELPIALYPRKFGDWAFSGSAIVDQENTSGLGSDGKPPLVAAFTSTARGECIVYSADNGRTFREFAGNPVVKHHGRDPRLLWHAPSKQWVMAVYDEKPDEKDRDRQQGIAFHTSPDLKQWTFRSRIDGFYECPDLFALPLDGDPARPRWVLTAASSDYRVGEFDGATFMPATPKLKGHVGRGYYAAQTFSAMPPGDTRCVQIGWMQAASPGMAFNQCMSLPLELGLVTTPDGPRLTWRPARELESLREHGRTMQNVKIAPGGELAFERIGAVPAEVRLTLAAGSTGTLALNVAGATIRLDPIKRVLSVGDVRAVLPADAATHDLTVYADRTTLELFACGGRVFMPLPHIATAEKPVLRAEGGEVALERVEAHALRSAW